MNKFFLFLYLVLLAGCSSKNQNSQSYSKKSLQISQNERDQLVGLWTAETQKTDGKFERLFMEQKSDGTFTFTKMTRNSASEKLQFDATKDIVEVGIWGISGDIYFTATRQFYSEGKVRSYDLSRVGLYDAYKILKLDLDTFEYQSVETGVVLTLKKLPENSKLSL